MIKIPFHQAALLKPLLVDEPPGFLIALGALNQPTCRIFVDNPSKPRCALLQSPTGWHSTLGNLNPESITQVTQFFFSQDALVHLKAYDIRTSRLAMIGNPFSLANPGEIPLQDREMIVLRAVSNEAVEDATDPRITDLTPDSYDEAVSFTPMLRKFWPDPTELVKNRMAKVFIENGTTKGICYSCFHSGDIHEPHITVTEQARSRGIGKALAQSYTNEIRRRGERLFWSHYTENASSGRLAASAGFVRYGSLRVIQRVIRNACSSSPELNQSSQTFPPAF